MLGDIEKVLDVRSDAGGKEEYFVKFKGTTLPAAHQTMMASLLLPGQLARQLCCV